MQARARRAAAVGALAAVVVAAIGAFYLRPWLAFAHSGAPPTPQPAAHRPPSLLQAQFVSPNVGWVVTGGAPSASLFRTADAGRHWQRQLDGLAGGWTLSFFDASRGVVYGADQRGPALWRTTDGGRRWTRTVSPCQPPPFLVTFADVDHGWCLATGSTDSAASAVPFLPDRQLITLFRTADGGAHWSRVLAIGEGHAVITGLGNDGQKAWIWFRDTEAGWIGQRSPDDRPAVYATADAGDHWVRQELPPPAGGWASGVGTWEEGPPGVGGLQPWMVVSQLTAGQQPGLISLVGRYLYLWRSSAWWGPAMLPNGALPAIDVTDDAHWLVANGAWVEDTTDAGQHWSPLGQVPAGWNIGRLSMSDRDRGWALLFSSLSPGSQAVPATALARSIDGGRHWALVPTPT